MQCDMDMFGYNGDKFGISDAVTKKISYIIETIKDEIPKNLERIYVQGEIAKIRIQSDKKFFILFDLLEKNANIKIGRKTYDNAKLSCKIAKSTLEKSDNLNIKEGMEIKVKGELQIYPPNSQLSLLIKKIELVGEGDIKKQYELLEKKLYNDGLFENRYMELPKFVENIGLITPQSGGRVKSDFKDKLIKLGFNIYVCDVTMEGPSSIEEITGAIYTIKDNVQTKYNKKIDVIVLIRGGGDWDNFEAFNSEKVVRAIRDSDVPIICGIGHNADESGNVRKTFADRAADLRVSTPTDAAARLNREWESARDTVNNFKEELESYFNKTNNVLCEQEQFLNIDVKRCLDRERNKIGDLDSKFQDAHKKFLKDVKSRIEQIDPELDSRFRLLTDDIESDIVKLEEQEQFLNLEVKRYLYGERNKIGNLDNELDSRFRLLTDDIESDIVKLEEQEQFLSLEVKRCLDRERNKIGDLDNEFRSIFKLLTDDIGRLDSKFQGAHKKFLKDVKSRIEQIEPEFDSRLKLLINDIKSNVVKLNEQEQFLNIDVKRCLDRERNKIGDLDSKFQDAHKKFLKDVKSRIEQIDPELDSRLKLLNNNFKSLSDDFGLTENELLSVSKKFLRNLENRIIELENSLENINPDNLLKLGYSIVLDEEEKVIKNARRLKTHDKIKIRFYEEDISLVVDVQNSG